MRCSEARKRLDGSRKNRDLGLLDAATLEHLRTCRACSADREIARILQILFETASVDSESVTDLARTRMLVESRQARRAEHNEHVFDRLSRFWHRLFRPGPALATLGVVTMVLLVTAIPFRYYQTIGYEVAVDGVEAELVENNETLCEMLSNLGLLEADIDVLECDTTCSLQIIYLKSRQEAQLVVHALADLRQPDIVTEVKAVRAPTRGTLLEKTGVDML